MISPNFRFTFDNLKKQYELIFKCGYRSISCREYCGYKNKGLKDKILVNRVDIDVCPKRAERLAQMFNEMGVKATFFIRLHAKEYNALSFENYRVFKFIRDSGHEIGYHSEVIDEAFIWGERPEDCLRKDIQLLETALNIKVQGVASHGGMTGLNNLDFWRQHKPKEFNLLYEAYDHEPEFNLFQESLYVSDSNWTSWKCYLNGIFQIDDKRTPAEHAREEHRVLALLIHPETYYDRHFYE